MTTRLTPAQRQMARDLRIPEADYAKHLPGRLTPAEDMGGQDCIIEGTKVRLSAWACEEAKKASPGLPLLRAIRKYALYQMQRQTERESNDH